MNMEVLVNQARAGDSESFVQLFESMELDMYKMARSILHQDQDCRDVMQETTLKAYRSISTLRRPEYFKTWVFRILINECHELLRRQKRRMEADHNSLDEKMSASFVLAEEYEMVELYEALDTLDVSLRLSVTLYYFHGMSVKEIASTLGVSQTAVKSRLYRARKQLAETLYSDIEGKVNYETTN